MAFANYVNWELKKRCQPFLGSYTTKWQYIKQSQTKNVPGYAFCTVCGCDVSVAHGGKDDVRRHIDSAKHIKITRLQHKVNQFQGFFQHPRRQQQVWKITKPRLK